MNSYLDHSSSISEKMVHLNEVINTREYLNKYSVKEENFIDENKI
jgi:hypothetical protein